MIGTGFDRILFRESIVSSGNDGSGPYIDEVVLKELVATPSPTSAPCVRTDTNLLCNGSFELNDVNSGSMGIFLEDNVSGWSSASGGFVCLINDLNIAAPNGQNYLALDCRAGGDIEGVFQDVPTVPGQEYRLTWKMRPADPNRFDLEDEGVNVSDVYFYFLYIQSLSGNCTPQEIFSIVCCELPPFQLVSFHLSL